MKIYLAAGVNKDLLEIHFAKPKQWNSAACWYVDTDYLWLKKKSAQRIGINKFPEFKTPELIEIELTVKLLPKRKVKK